MKQHVIGIMATCAMVTMLSSCSDHDVSGLLPEHDAACTPMTFTAQQEPLGDETRIEYIESAEQISDFYLVAEHQNEVIDHQRYYLDGAVYYGGEEEIYWPNDSREQVTFFAINSSEDYNLIRDAVEVYDDAIGDIVLTPLNNKALDVPHSVVMDFQQDMIAAYAEISAKQTVNGQAPLLFRHMLGEVGIYAKVEATTDYPDEVYKVMSVTLEPATEGETYRSYHFDTNTWGPSTASEALPSAPTLYYFSSAAETGWPLSSTTDYVELLETIGSVPPSAGDSHKFLIPGNYKLVVLYTYDADGDGTTYGLSNEEKTCTVTIEQGKKNRINLTLPALDAVPRTW